MATSSFRLFQSAPDLDTIKLMLKLTAPRILATLAFYTEFDIEAQRDEFQRDLELVENKINSAFKDSLQ